MPGQEPVPEILAGVLRDRSLKTRRKRLTTEDRAAYSAWVSAAKDERTARDRAVHVSDRVADGRPWVGPLRRRLERLVGVPRGTTPREAWDADAGDGWAGWAPGLD